MLWEHFDLARSRGVSVSASEGELRSAIINQNDDGRAETLSTGESRLDGLHGGNLCPGRLVELRGVGGNRIGPCPGADIPGVGLVSSLVQSDRSRRGSSIRRLRPSGMPGAMLASGKRGRLADYDLQGLLAG